MRTWIGIGLVALAATACDEDDATLEGTYDIQIGYIEDTCADDEGTSEAAVMTLVRLDNDLWRIEFGEEGTLEGTLDATGILQASGDALLTLTVDGVPTDVLVDITMQVGQFRTGEIEASGIMVFNGTFPGVEGVCQRTFGAQGDPRDQSSVLLMTGPDGR